MYRIKCVLASLLIILVYSCSNYEDLGKEDSVWFLKSFLVSNYDGIVLPDYFERTTKADPIKKDVCENSLILLWDKMRKSYDKGIVTYEIPIATATTIIADIARTEDGVTSHRCSRYSPYLIITETDDSYVAFTSIIIKDAFSKSSYLFYDEKYEDFMLISDLEGNIVDEKIRHHGKCYSYVPNLVDVKDFESKSNGHNVIIGYRLAKKYPTKVDIPDNGENFWEGIVTCHKCGQQYNCLVWDNGCYYCGANEYTQTEYCNFCMLPLEDCVCADSDKCPDCGRMSDFCTCDPTPNKDDVCEYCGRTLLECDTHCQEICPICNKKKIDCAGHHS